MENSPQAPSTSEQASTIIAQDSAPAPEPRGYFSQYGQSFTESTHEEAPQAQETPESAPETPSNAQETPEPAPQQDEFVSQRLAMIMKKEREILEREKQFKSMQEKAKPDQEEYDRYKRAMELKDYDPMGALEALGLSYDQISQHYQNEENPTSRREALLQKEIDELKQWRQEEINRREERKKQEEENQKKAKYEEQYSSYINDFKQIVGNEKAEDGSLTYEYIDGEDAYDLVYETANQLYLKEKKIPDQKRVLDMVEKHLEENFQRMLKYKKSGKYGQQENPDNFFSGNQPQESTQRITSPQTLTNSFARTSPPANSNKPLSREESLRRAADLIQFDD